MVDVQVLDLQTGDVTTIFQTPPAAWISGAAVSPDGKTGHRGVSSRRAADELGGQETLYVMPVDGPEPPSLLLHARSPRRTGTFSRAGRRMARSVLHGRRL